MTSDFPDIHGHRIIRRIGSGGMATVYLAEQLGAGRKVAIKVLLPEHNNDAEAVQRFENEARTIGQLDHPHIVRIFDVGRSTGGQAYFTMPWLPRGDLTQQRNRREPAAIMRNMRALLQALDYAHERGIIHRDVKPENVMFDAANRAQLADFGIALSTQGSVRLTRPGATVGSSGYMSPEQSRGLPTDGRSDLYSLGVMLYELLTGEMPFQGPDALSVSIAHVEDPIPALPPAQRVWQPLIDKAMAKAPEDRFASAGDMLAALEEIAPVALSGDAGHGLWWHVVQRWSRHNRGVLIGVVALLLTVVTLVLLALARERMTQRQQAGASSTARTGSVALAGQALLSTAQLDRLIREGNIRLSLGALTDPPGNNAGERFARILHAYPNNPEALAGLSVLYDKLSVRIDKALADRDGQQALHLYQRAQRMADRAGIRQQAFWQQFVVTTRDAIGKNLARASRQSQKSLDALRPIADALDIAVPALKQRSAQTTVRTADTSPARTAKPASAFVRLKTSDGKRFTISRHPVSRRQYARFIRESGRKPAFCRTPGNFFSRLRNLNWFDPGFDQKDSQPVYCVSWQDARAFAGWYSQTSGHGYRLPTKGEWMAAAQADTRGLKFPAGTREWLRCSGACEDAPIITADGKLDREDADNGYTHVGFRLVRDQ